MSYVYRNICLLIQPTAFPKIKYFFFLILSNNYSFLYKKIFLCLIYQIKTFKIQIFPEIIYSKNKLPKVKRKRWQRLFFVLYLIPLEIYVENRVCMSRHTFLTISFHVFPRLLAACLRLYRATSKREVYRVYICIAQDRCGHLIIRFNSGFFFIFFIFSFQFLYNMYQTLNRIILIRF